VSAGQGIDGELIGGRRVNSIKDEGAKLHLDLFPKAIHRCLEVRHGVGRILAGGEGAEGFDENGRSKSILNWRELCGSGHY